jgi:hypothetical protein
MGLSNDLISQFVKITKDDTKDIKETTAYGTVAKIERGDNNDIIGVWVRLDGAEEGQLTPLARTTDVELNDRVIVMIKNHSAVITGNITSPSARTEYVKVVEQRVESTEDKVSEFDYIIADSVTIKNALAVHAAAIETLEADRVTVKEILLANTADIDTLEAENVTIRSKLNTNEADISNLKTSKLDAETAEITYAKVDALNASNALIGSLSAAQAAFETATTNKFTALDATIDRLNTDKLSATDIEGKYANIDFSNIGKAAIEYFYATSGLIENVVVGDGTITGNLVGVTISGDLIEGNTVKADKLVIKGSDGLYYKLNTDGMVTEAEQTNQNSLDGSVIKAKSITATKISVSDLVAFGATIGGINIASGALYSGSKNSVGNTTTGVYIDSQGQMAVGGINNYIKYYIDSSGNRKLDISADSFRFGSSKKTINDAIDDIQVGGRNLYVEKNASVGYLSSDGAGNVTAPGGVTREKTSDFIPVEEGDILQYQIWVTTPSDSYVWYAYQFFKDDKTPLIAGAGGRPAQHRQELAGGTYHVAVDPIVTPEGASYLRVSARLFNDGKIKVEKGTKPTDWTPAPEDMATSDEVGDAVATAESAHTRVAEAEALIELLSESISMLVTDGSGASLMTQTENGWTFSTASLQDLVDHTSESLNDLTNKVGDVDSAVGVLQQAVSDLGTIAEYVKIGTYEGEPCIELGEGDSDFKLLITNTRIMFKEGTNVPAYFNNQSMHIRKAVIEEELQQGGFVWKVRSNGNMGLVWKGGTS